jgi:ComF family protein
LPLTEYSFNEENAVDRIFYGRTDVKKASSFLFYTENGIVQNLIHHLKYRNQPEIGNFLGDWFGLLLAQNGYVEPIDLVIPVPLHPIKLKKRGYNQVTLFAQKLAEHLQTDFNSEILLKTANTKTQTRKSRNLRGRQRPDLYILSDPSLISGKNVLLVDDVITTGATIEVCARALHKAPNVKIYVATMAVVP